MLSDRAFQIITGGGKSKGRRIMNNGLPQSSVLVFMLFNLHITDIPDTKGWKFTYANDLALGAQEKHMEDADSSLTEDLNALGKFFAEQKQGISTLIINKQKMSQRNTSITACCLTTPFPKHLGIMLDLTLSYKKHIENTAGKINTRNNILIKLCGTK